MKPTISREYGIYMMKGLLVESPDRPWPLRNKEAVDAHKRNLKEGFEAHIFRLPQPILCERDTIRDVFELQINEKKARLYPPFELNDVRENAGAFDGVKIPEGNSTVESFREISISVSKSLSVMPVNKDQNVTFCQGLRLDIENGFNASRLIENLLEQICQHTHQWWLRSSASPFNGLMRFGAEIDKENRLREELKYAGAKKIESAWYVARETQRLSGIETPLTNGKWLLVCHNVSVGQKADSGVIAFHDALASYMAQDDVRCVLNLCLCIEILGNKRRLLCGLIPVSADLLVKTTDLVSDDNKIVIKSLFVDRGHVAHGREPPNLNKNREAQLASYLDATRGFLSGYLNSLKPGEWPEASQLVVRRKKKKKI